MAPATHRVQIDKGIGSAHWSNDYLVTATDLAAATSMATSLWGMERTLHGTVVTFNWARISTVTLGDRVFVHQPINLQGTLDMGAGDYLPLFNTVRADLGTASSDPARKYFRVPIMEAWQANGAIDPTISAMLLARLSVILPGGASAVPIVTSRGNVVVSASIHPQVQMRQLARRSKRKVVTP